ncbi:MULTISPECIES: VWA domain-containing protein [unclassified Pseudomonas]|uniref:VWA domain-containing protein n=1 Tax=unclassified Pseudomonas TaxID=196821 RepID=UPI00129DAB75|nr:MULTISPECIES: VWA domain-containing protein [unclassified Pseudomonas]MDH4656705.1 VWA domain-containing protein [Pseudomonas sp. BN606]MRK23103.1 VWA domain-containing protein [Pseudomonas sp. JG-B]
MMELWPHWLRPIWLLLLPLLGWLLWQLWHRERRSGRWEQLLPRAFQPWLLSGGSQRNNRLPWLALGLAWLLCLLALLGPTWQQMEQSTQKRADPLVVMLELTPSMLASDIAPSRLEQAKRKLRDLLDARRDAQTAIVVYAGSAHSLVPLSDDLMTSLNLIDSLKPSIMPQQGHRADLAVAKALTLLEQGAQGQGRLLLITSGLDDEEQAGIRKALGSRAERLVILGIGTAAGAPIAQEGGGFLKDDQGAILLPKLDGSQLRRFAANLGGRYAEVRLDEGDLRSLELLDGPSSLRESGEIARLAAWADQGHWLLLPLLLIAACAGRRGWLFCLPLLLVLPRPSLAMDFEDLWLRPDQQGQRLLEAQQPAEAARRFSDPRWQGIALYQAGDYTEAATRFAQGDTAADHYNRGNALAQAGELEAAVDAYDSALQRQPDLAAATKNKTLVEDLLRQREAESRAGDQEAQNSEKQQTGQGREANAAKQQEGEQSAEQNAQQQAGGETQPGGSTRPGQGGTAEQALSQNTTQSQSASNEPLGDERRQALEQWLRQIPDDPAELLRRKFWYEQQQRQEEQ